MKGPLKLVTSLGFIEIHIQTPWDHFPSVVPQLLCPLLANSGHFLNGGMMGLGPLTLCPLMTQSGHQALIEVVTLGVERQCLPGFDCPIAAISGRRGEKGSWGRGPAWRYRQGAVGRV